jgi:hypoxanthine-DNA glycosylase
MSADRHRRAAATAAGRREIAEAAGAPAKRSFAPILGENPRVLVLGTLPGEESLRVQQYYAHPRNLFWPILFALFDAVPAADYDTKLAFARARRVALWDVCAEGEREASADTTIRREVPNRIDRLLDAHPSIGTVAFNGTGARRLHDRHFPRRPHLAYLAMPSTSPAPARLDFAAKLAKWAALREVLVNLEPDQPESVAQSTPRSNAAAAR